MWPSDNYFIFYIILLCILATENDVTHEKPHSSLKIFYVPPEVGQN
jgi:hypothetical protein